MRVKKKPVAGFRVPLFGQVAEWVQNGNFRARPKSSLQCRISLHGAGTPKSLGLPLWLRMAGFERSGLHVQAFWFRVWGLGFRGLGSRVWGSRVQGCEEF